MSLRTCFALVTMALIISPAVHAATAVVEVQPTQEDSNVTGKILFEDTDEGLRLHGEVRGLKPNAKHGFHIHEFGSCADAGSGAGSHFNPYGAPHGFLPDDQKLQSHAGDFGNLASDEAGTAKIDILVPGLRVEGTSLAVAGRAIIVHEKEDDFSQPLGNAGARIGCGAITITG